MAGGIKCSSPGIISKGHSNWLGVVEEAHSLAAAYLAYLVERVFGDLDEASEEVFVDGEQGALEMRLEAAEASFLEEVPRSLHFVG